MPIYFDLMSKDFPFVIESLGINWNQDEVSRPEGYPYYHWLQSTQGVGEIQFANKKISLPAGCGILIAPFYPHRYYKKSSEEWHTSFVTLSGNLAPSLSDIFQEENYFFIPNGHYFSQWTENIFNHLKKQDYTSLEYSVASYDFLLHLQKESQVKAPVDNKLYQTYLKPAISYMEKHFAQDISIENLAQQVFITPQYLTRLFQRFFHVTTLEYLNQVRIKKAKEILITKNETEIQVISQLVGFKSSSHFIATFKKATGYTPMAFRDLYI